MSRISGRRSAAARAYRRLYKTKEWKAARRSQLAEHPLCEPCQARGLVVAATVVNHRQPHRGDEGVFFDPDNWQSLCKPCHDSEAQSQEKSGREWDKAIGPDGWPIDSRHPVYRET